MLILNQHFEILYLTWQYRLATNDESNDAYIFKSVFLTRYISAIEKSKYWHGHGIKMWKEILPRKAPWLIGSNHLVTLLYNIVKLKSPQSLYLETMY